MKQEAQGHPAPTWVAQQVVTAVMMTGSRGSTMMISNGARESGPRPGSGEGGFSVGRPTPSPADKDRHEQQEQMY